MTEAAHCCAHCGDDCDTQEVMWQDMAFCCNGCAMVYQLLEESGMGQYYKLEKTPGFSQDRKPQNSYEYLDDAEVVNRLLDFQENNIARITFALPQIHCSSCLWLLERIHKFDIGIISSRVDFLSKKVSIQYDNENTSLKDIVQLLSSIGYEPELNLGKLDQRNSNNRSNKTILYKLGLAGFSFGNIMLLSFPEYFGLNHGLLKSYVGYINIGLAIPVLFYSGSEYLRSAYHSLRHGGLNIDVPIAIGITTLFVRSVYDIISHTSEGYLDSLAGLILFLLIGKWFQNFTYQSLDFDRNYKSYFPISTLRKHVDKWTAVSLDKISPNDYILIKNEELIPVDALIVKGEGKIDYSFVTGESDLMSKSIGERVFAGGKQKGSNLELKVIKKVDQSYLTNLWNEDIFKDKHESSSGRVINIISKYFTIVILGIGVVTFLYWLRHDISIAFNAFTAVLIVACPCALALSIPFTYGNILRILSRAQFFLRNVNTIEDIQDVSHIVFDKTGTLTDHSKIKMSFVGHPLQDSEIELIKTIASQSSHPLSKVINQMYPHTETLEVSEYQEEVGKGTMAYIGKNQIKIGSQQYILGDHLAQSQKGVFVEINNTYRGVYQYHDQFRKGISNVLDGLKSSYKISVLSGDSDRDIDRITKLFDASSQILFNQSPKDKLNYINDLQTQGKTVMMIGDGLNDAGALKKANVGIVIADEGNNFTPASDAILSAARFYSLLSFLTYIKHAKWVIYGSFILALSYNTVGLYYATTGQLSPVIAAILMPLSSITIIVYGVLMSTLLSRRIHLDHTR